MQLCRDMFRTVHNSMRIVLVSVAVLDAQIIKTLVRDPDFTTAVILGTDYVKNLQQTLSDLKARTSDLFGSSEPSKRQNDTFKFMHRLELLIQNEKTGLQL